MAGIQVVSLSSMDAKTLPITDKQMIASISMGHKTYPNLVEEFITGVIVDINKMRGMVNNRKLARVYQMEAMQDI